MKTSTLFQLSLASSEYAASIRRAGNASAPAGTGPYPATWSIDPALVNHTIYAPAAPPSDLKLPVIVWGETGCTYDGLVFQGFLTEVASHGIMIMANGAPHGPSNPNGVAETSNPDGSGLTAGVDFIVKNAGKGMYANVDSSRIASAGQSCGGMQAYMLAHDDRVRAIGIFDSGYIGASQAPASITKPIFYFLGGPTDIAYVNGERDYTVLPASTPKWKGNLPVGHMATYFQLNGGKFGIAASRWAEWLLRGNATAAEFFTRNRTDTAVGAAWNTTSAALASIKVTPIA